MKADTLQRSLRERVCLWFLNKYGDDTSNLFLHAGAIGWVLSSMAQTCAIAFNDKIEPYKKNFLIPQEIADGIVNVCLFYALTSSITGLVKKLINMHKIRFDESAESLKILNLKKGANLQELKIPAGLEGSKLETVSKYHAKIVGVAAAVSLGMQILACNILTPILRNKYASYRQKKFLDERKKTFIYNSDSGCSYQPRLNIKKFLENYPKTPSNPFSKGCLFKV